MITHLLGGRLGNLLLETFECFYYCDKNGIPFDKIVFNKDTKIGCPDGNQTYFTDNFPIFKNIADRFIDEKTFNALVKDNSKLRHRVLVANGIAFKDDFWKTRENLTFFDSWVMPDENPELFFKLYYNEQQFYDIFMKNNLSRYENIIAIHVRRGDKINQFNNIIDRIRLEIDAILNKNKNQKFLIVSEDIAWCEQEFNSDNFMIAGPGLPYEHFILLSLCDDIIISSGSTFSLCARALSRKLKEHAVKSSFNRLINIK